MNLNTRDTQTLRIGLLSFGMLAALISTLILMAVSIGNVTAGEKGSKSTQMDIVDTASASGDFKTLVTAIKAAGLVETLKGEGPFTVFAPTDAAFDRIPTDQLNDLLQDKDALTTVLTYHVVSGKVMAADVVKLKSAKTVQGQSIKIDASDGVKVDDAKVIQTDIETSNGVIHVIDTVMLPKT